MTIKFVDDQAALLWPFPASLDNYEPIASANERNGLRKLADQSISRLLAQVADIRSYRNSLATISLLPSDVLCQIFRKIVSFDPWSLQNRARLMSVCREWRDTARGDAGLWAYLNTEFVKDQDLARRWTERAKDHPLHARYDLLASELAYMPARLKPNINRIETLEVSASSLDALDRFFGGVEQMPLLRSLIVRKNPTDDEEGNPEWWYLPDFLFEGGVPKLDTLRIQDCLFRRMDHLSSLRNMTALKLSLIEMDDDERGNITPSLSDFLQILHHSPLLQELHIRFYIQPEPTAQGQEDSDPTPNSPLHSPPPPQTYPIVNLAYLRHLNITLEPDTLIALWSHLAIPPTTSLSLMPSYIDNTSRTSAGKTPCSLSKILILVRKHLSRIGSPPLRSVRLESDSTCTRVVADSSYDTYADNSDLSTTERRQPHFSMVTHPYQQAAVRNVVVRILNALPLRHPRGGEGGKGREGEVEPLWFDATHTIGEETGGLTKLSWTTIFSCLNMPLKIRMGGNMATMVMLDGFLDAMRKLATPKEKRRYKHRFGGLEITRLHIYTWLDPVIWTHSSPTVEDDEHTMDVVDKLVEVLQSYRDLEGVPWKPAGKRLEVMVTEKARHQFPYLSARWKLQTVCQTVRLRRAGDEESDDDDN